MKELLILRHARTRRNEPRQRDHERPLTEEGRREAPWVGRLLREEALVPDLIVSSTAVRALSTALLVAENSGYVGDILTRATLYLAEVEQLLDVVITLPESVGRVLLIGHNPGLEDLVSHLTGRSVHLPTAALVHLMLPIERWDDRLRSSQSELRGNWYPG